MESELNAFEACRGLAQRARDINQDRKGKEMEGAVPEEGQPNSSASAMLEFTNGRIVLGHLEDEED